MELHQLRYLRAVVHLGSVTRAAEAEHVSQPSISKQVRLLERELGQPLLHRVGRRVVPTEAGIVMARCAGRIFDDLATTTDLLAELRSSVRGYLRICATETVTDHLLPPVLAAVRAQRPGVHISVEMLGTDDAVVRLLNDEADLAIVVLPLADSRLTIAHLFEEEIVLAVPASHPWARRKSVALGEALGEPSLLLSMPGHGLRAQLEREAQARGITLDSHLDLRSQHALLRMVAHGAGVAFAPRISLADLGAGAGIVALRLDPPLRREIGWVTRRGRRPPPIAVLLLDLLRIAVEKLIPPPVDPA